MTIDKIRIQNFKIFKQFEMDFNPDLNILVGNNGSGKSTILEAINLALTGYYHGKPAKTELSQDMFNKNSVDKYIKGVKDHTSPELPAIVIELYMSNIPSIYSGTNNSLKTDSMGIRYTIEFDEDYKDEYSEVLKQDSVKSLPIEYYTCVWESFAEKAITYRSVPTKTSYIDSSSYRYQNGFDVYISKIMKNLMSPHQEVQIMQAHRKMKESFMENESIRDINENIRNSLSGPLSKVSISVELGTKSAWETSLVTQLDDISFDNIGKGNQCILKTEMALLVNIEPDSSNVILIEEPENHLSYSNMNELIDLIASESEPHQTIITTHSSFVINRLGLGNIHILSSDGNVTKLNNLDPDGFFKKRSGYDTLRIVLSRKVILVEGDSDDLIVQKAYKNKYGRLPITDGVDVITVGTTFARFLEIAKCVKVKVNVALDNDGKTDSIRKKYEPYQQYDNIKVFYADQKACTPDYNNNTLEPEMIRANGVELMNSILGVNKSNFDSLAKYMIGNKVECALKIFDSNLEMNFPDYILKAIEFDE